MTSLRPRSSTAVCATPGCCGRPAEPSTRSEAGPELSQGHHRYTRLHRVRTLACRSCRTQIKWTGGRGLVADRRPFSLPKLCIFFSLVPFMQVAQPDRNKGKTSPTRVWHKASTKLSSHAFGATKHPAHFLPLFTFLPVASLNMEMHFIERKEKRNYGPVYRGEFLEDFQQESSVWPDIGLEAGVGREPGHPHYRPSSGPQLSQVHTLQPRCPSIHHWPLSGIHSAFLPTSCPMAPC